MIPTKRLVEFETMNGVVIKLQATPEYDMRGRVIRYQTFILGPLIPVKSRDGWFWSPMLQTLLRPVQK